MPSARPTRRAVLRGLAGMAVGAGLGLAGCTSANRPTSDPTSPAQPSASAAPSIDEQVRERVAAASRDLADRYAEARAAHPQLEARLAPLAAEHAAHAQVLDPAGAARPEPTGAPSSAATATATATATSTATTTATPTATATSSAPASATASPAPSPAQTVARLAAVEAASAAARLRDVLVASPALARLVASVAACHATHAAVLDTVP
jgi:hypothetical protein